MGLRREQLLLFSYPKLYPPPTPEIHILNRDVSQLTSKGKEYKINLLMSKSKLFSLFRCCPAFEKLLCTGRTTGLGGAEDGTLFISANGIFLEELCRYPGATFELSDNDAPPECIDTELESLERPES